MASFSEAISDNVSSKNEASKTFKLDKNFSHHAKESINNFTWSHLKSKIIILKCKLPIIFAIIP